ncbi:MAG: ThiF family adenylyltransferase [Candidatus Riflebacteria bacterium]|nr:ThiF family adenylyltransferase [Candidatus Riflebacteria bacterium]
MNSAVPAPPPGGDQRFARFRAIEWWDQARLANARVLVVGVGALGNEVVKNLALLGVGHVALIDKDRVEQSNLSRSVLFRPADDGQPKAGCAARAARSIYPGIDVVPVVGDVLADVGLGLFRWADAVIGALDNRETRLFVNSACARLGRPWVDGGIDVFQGIVRGFAPPVTACYECTMSRVDWDLLNKRRSCSLLARRAAATGGTPTTPTVASIVGAIQAQEVVKLLHGMDGLFGKGYVFEGLAHSSYGVTYPRDPACPWHDPAPPVDPDQGLTSDSPLEQVFEHARGKLGGLDALDLSREIVEAVECPRCGQVEPVFEPAEKVPEGSLLCRSCGVEQAPRFVHSVERGSKLLGLSVRQIGLPEWDVIWARNGMDILGIEIAGDRPGGVPRECPSCQEEGAEDGVR